MRGPRFASMLLGLGAIAAVAAGAPVGPGHSPGAKPALPFISNDYPKALAQARAREVPLFIESWAPW